MVVFLPNAIWLLKTQWTQEILSLLLLVRAILGLLGNICSLLDVRGAGSTWLHMLDLFVLLYPVYSLGSECVILFCDAERGESILEETSEVFSRSSVRSMGSRRSSTCIPNISLERPFSLIRPKSWRRMHCSQDLLYSEILLYHSVMQTSCNCFWSAKSYSGCPPTMSPIGLHTEVALSQYDLAEQCEMLVSMEGGLQQEEKVNKEPGSPHGERSAILHPGCKGLHSEDGRGNIITHVESKSLVRPRRTGKKIPVQAPCTKRLRICMPLRENKPHF